MLIYPKRDARIDSTSPEVDDAAAEMARVVNKVADANKVDGEDAVVEDDTASDEVNALTDNVADAEDHTSDVLVVDVVGLFTSDRCNDNSWRVVVVGGGGGGGVVVVVDVVVVILLVVVEIRSV